MFARTQKKNVNVYPFLRYTGWFILLSAIIFSAFAILGKTFIWEGDGFHQHYPFFHEYLTMLRDFFATGQWQSWDWSIGLGQDTLLTYGYYVIGDPFVYLGLLFPQGQEELAFHVVMLVRIWCVGASFLLYARYMNFSSQSALMGSLMYAFNHYVIYNVIRHPFFIHPMIFFPLLCLGIEKVFRKESGVLFMTMTALSAASNFYFFYMLTLMMFLYALLRYKHFEKNNDWRVFARWLGYFIVLYLIGLLISAIIFVPLVYGFLNASRSANFPPISLFLYPIHYYLLLIINSITPGTIYWTVGGLSVVGVLTLPFLTHRRKENPALFWVFVILFIMLLFPFFGSLMNGLSGPYNRFTFVVPFYLAIALAYFADNSIDLKTADVTGMRRLLIGFSIVFGITSLVTDEYLFYLTPLVIGWSMYALTQAQAREQLTPLAFKQGLLILVVCNVATNALNFYLPYGKNAMAETEDYGTIDETYASVFEGVEQTLPQDDLYRVNVSSHDNHVRNQYASLDVYGTNSYASLTNGGVADFSKVIESSQYQIIQPLRNGIDDRRVANQALGVKYIVTDDDYVAYLPPDYEVNDALSGKGMIVAETANEAPFAYVEAEGLSRREVMGLHPVERESLLAGAVILEENNPNVNPSPEIVSLDTYNGTWEAGSGIMMNDGANLNESLNFTVTEENGELILHFEEPGALVNQEVFIYFEGLAFQPPKTLPLVQESTSYRLNVTFNKQEKSVLQSDKYSFSSYFKRDDMLVHLNEVTAAEDSLSVHFDQPGHYRMDNVSVVSRPSNPDRISELAQEKNDNALAIDIFSNEYVSGTITSEKAGMLVTAMPYSAGWQAFVDGEEVSTEKVNIGFVGLPLTEGDHRIEFFYQTPFLKTGLLLTIIGLISMVGYVIVYKRMGRSEE